MSGILNIENICCKEFSSTLTTTISNSKFPSRDVFITCTKYPLLMPDGRLLVIMEGKVNAIIDSNMQKVVRTYKFSIKEAFLFEQIKNYKRKIRKELSELISSFIFCYSESNGSKNVLNPGKEFYSLKDKISNAYKSLEIKDEEIIEENIENLTKY